MSNQLNPFTPDQQQVITKLLSNATPHQIHWLSGYLSGLTHQVGTNISSETSTDKFQENTQSKSLTILFGTHTGHSEALAYQLEERANEKGILTKVVSLDDYKVRNLNKEEHLALIVSTHGEGEPPLMAEALHEFVKSGKAKLSNLKYSILALGDRSYKLFCQTGVDFDTAFSRLGATEIYPIVKCDVDYEALASKWINDLVANLDLGDESNVLKPKKAVKTKSKYSKSNPFYAEVLDKRKITGRYSDKEVWHLELSLEKSGLDYEPGDSLGVYSNNPPGLVQQIIDFTQLSSNATVTTRIDDVTLYEALYHQFEITVLNRKVLEDYNLLAKSKKLDALLKHEEKLDAYLFGNDLLDLLQDYPTKLTPHQLISVLRYLPPRLYSISSSYEANPDEVHITIGKVDYESRNRKRKGACSSYISDRLLENEKVPVFIEKNINFRLPKEKNVPLIMIGAGTGVAPYRAFLQELEINDRENDSWLFFGERTFNEDFLYQVEWQKFLKNKVLGKIELAFSRDQKEKVYVQHKLKSQASEVFNWLEKGAHLYVCGDRKKMFADVQNTLLNIIQTQGGVSEEKAEEYLHRLKREKRYQLDVY